VVEYSTVAVECEVPLVIVNPFETGRRAPSLGCVGVLTVGICVFAGGCGAFNPAFLDLLDPTGSGSFATLDNAPGHVVVYFANNAEVDERLITYLESAEGGGLVFSDAEKRSLRPRVRLRVSVTFTNGTTQTIEFIDGTPDLVEQNFDAQAFPDLNQNDLNQVAVICDVARVEVVDPIEVFIPITWSVYNFVEPTGFNEGFYRLASEESPKFVQLQVDDVDEDLNTLLRRNIGIRDVASPVSDLQCGSVVAITLDGVLSVPFFRPVGNVPGFDNEDLESAASLGGRYEFIVSVN
jgi:hypothetical protein